MVFATTKTAKIQARNKDDGLTTIYGVSTAETITPEFVAENANKILRFGNIEIIANEDMKRIQTQEGVAS